MRPAALAADPLVPTVDSQRSLAPRHEASTGTKLSQHAAQRDHPVQNSPRTHKNADFGPLSAHRENLFTLTPITSHAGRTLYRTRGRCRYKTLPAHRPGGITRYKTLPARGPVGPTRYKTLPARPKYPFSAHFEPAGRVLYRFHHHQAGSSPVEWCNRFVSFGVGYALSWSVGSSCWVGWGVSRDLVRMSRLR